MQEYVVELFCEVATCYFESLSLNQNKLQHILDIIPPFAFRNLRK